MAKIKDLVLLRDGFTFKGRRYDDSTISNIRLSNVQINYKYGGLYQAGNVKEVTFEMRLNTGDKIKINSEDWDQINPIGLLLSAIRNKQKERDEIFIAYQQLCKRTFQQRLDFYLSQLDAYGYFVYDECKFYPGSKILFRDTEFKLSESILINHGGRVIELTLKSPSSMEKFKREWSFTKTPQFSLSTDSDAIGVLLNKLFGLEL